jgi:hypothetical protein
MAKRKVSPAQVALLRGMQNHQTLHAYGVQGNAPPLWPTRSAWVQDYTRYAVNPGMRSILPSTLDALLWLGLVEEEHRYKASTHTMEGFTWDNWTINYRLIEQGKAVIETG